jgi:hypothetical protein
MNKKKLIEGVDFTWIELDGIKFRLFTKKFLLERGYCCKNGCKNCPYKKK